MRIATEESRLSKPAKETTHKEKTGLSKAQFTDVFMTLVKTAAESFRDKWNSHNPEDQIDIRFILHRNKIENHTQIKAQAMLTFEIRRNFEWVVTSRTVSNFASEKFLKDMETEYTFQLWSDMFSEITQIGFIAVINYLANKSNGTEGQAGAEGDKLSIVSGDLDEVEDLSTKG